MILIVSRTAERMLKRKLDIIGVHVCCSVPATKLRHNFCSSENFSELRLGWRACLYAGLNITRPLLLSDCNHHSRVSKNVSKTPALNVMTGRLVLFENLNYYKIIHFFRGLKILVSKVSRWHFFVFGRLWLQISARPQTNPSEDFLWLCSVAPGKSLV
jgi:hypothetical protein